MATRSTRSGREFSPYALRDPIVVDFDVEELLQLRYAELDDLDHLTDSEDVLEPPSGPIDGDSDLTDLDSSWSESDVPSAPSAPSSIHPDTRSQIPQTSHRKDSHRRRRYKRAQKQAASGSNVKEVAARHADTRLPAITTDVDAAEFPVASGGWKGKRQAPHKKTRRTKESLMADGFQLVSYEPGSRPITDRHRRMCVLITGKPGAGDNDDNGEGWNGVITEMAEAIELGRKATRFAKKACIHKRGPFPAPAIGISYGGGELAPGNHALSKGVRVFMEGLLRNPAFIRWAGHVNRAFQVHNPPLHQEYADHLDRLIDALPHLRRNFKKSPFACMTVNCGPRVICEEHTDGANKPDGWCAVTPLGPFNSRKGGHLVLWDLRLIIEFPAGCTIYLPSALLRHSNLPIQKHERRYSVTQYSAGGLFRWIYNGGRTDQQFFEDEKVTDEEIEQWHEDRKIRYQQGLRFFPVV